MAPTELFTRFVESLLESGQFVRPHARAKEDRPGPWVSVKVPDLSLIIRALPPPAGTHIYDFEVANDDGVVAEGGPEELTRFVHHIAAPEG